MQQKHMIELHRAAGEITDHVRCDGQLAILLRGFQRFDAVSECLPRLVLPGLNGFEPLVPSVFVGHRGIGAEAGCKARGVVAIADVEVGLNGLR
ncbi:hypothetical protein D3C71_1914990 [compost metagenome]